MTRSRASISGSNESEKKGTVNAEDKDANEIWINISDSRLALGGPNETALSIDANLHHGFSEGCSVFGSPALSALKREKKRTEFKVVAVEAW
eukprot:CAMPEP_0184482402 /NCGR_PEP_ID=MMETSP0113_2-20130426/3961_1 /TAXON_ID=91329 /ORGANISM="Norrisiella sphaerica, Strain BC52" /LENGTH=91 /DNA_ID=CAMNT_0026862107 /DNA_START=298 /DNA_END=570 /DNA_ORIENTATION=+